jgi:hypothetical protein
VVYAETRGQTSSMDIISSLASLLDHPSYSSGMRVLLDMRGVAPSLHRPDILTIATYVRDHAARIGALEMAVVVPLDSSFGMAQEQKAALEGSSVHLEVFRDISDAREWLGLLREDAR